MIISFAGHSILPNKVAIERSLQAILSDQIAKHDFVHFYCGGYGEFDTLCARCLRDLKQVGSNFEIVLITPYLSFLNTSDLYDAQIYPPLESVPKRVAILRRNQWMVDQSDLIIAYVSHSHGGAFQTLEYARKKNREIINLASFLQV